MGRGSARTKNMGRHTTLLVTYQTRREHSSSRGMDMLRGHPHKSMLRPRSHTATPGRPAYYRPPRCMRISLLHHLTLRIRKPSSSLRHPIPVRLWAGPTRTCGRRSRDAGSSTRRVTVHEASRANSTIASILARCNLHMPPLMPAQMMVRCCCPALINFAK